jgi:cytochrome bd ubiquinol oxidase subunit I
LGIEFAKRSFVVAASFGLASALSVVVLGDESGYTITTHQQMKIATIEGMWKTEPAPASFTIFGIPDQKNLKTDYQVTVPWALGLIATRSLDGEVKGIVELVEEGKQRIRSGMIGYGALKNLRSPEAQESSKLTLKQHSKDLGYALLLKQYTDDVISATDSQIDQAAWDTVPRVAPLFWSFRIMVGLGFYFILFFGFAFYVASRGTLLSHPNFLRVAILSLPTPWIAAELGWVVAEYGRQPWTIDGILPTFLSGSGLNSSSVWITLIAFITFYTILAVVDVLLMKKYIKLGPQQALAPKGGKAHAY